MHQRYEALLRGSLCGAVMLWLAVAASGQFTASVQGTVTDTAGATVSGAVITVVNQDTGKEQSTVTSDAGFYRVSGLPPGRYTISAGLAGFKKKTVSDVIVKAEATQGLDLVLDPGDVSETVTVTADAAGQALQTENANINKGITEQEIRRLPQVGRDPYELIRLAPGVFGDGSRAANGNAVNLPNTTGPGGSNTSIFQVENQVPISANGQRVSANNFQIDGVSVNSLGHGGAAVVTPNQESVKEIQVRSTTYSAEDGRNTGAQIKVVSQSGTNEFHGSALIKYNDPDLNAFNKFGGITPGNPNANSAPVRVEQLFRQFGASLGGPVLRDKLFFFFSYEGLRNSSNNFLNTFVETPQFRQIVTNQRSGGVTARVFQSPGIEPRIVEFLMPSCGVFGSPPSRPCAVVAGGLDIGSLTGSLGTYVDSFDGDAQLAGGGLDGIPDLMPVRLAVPSRTVGDQFNTRIDFSKGTGDHFAVSTYFTRRNDRVGDAAGKSRPMADLTFKPLNSAATVAWIHTISPTTLNEARANFTRFAFDQVESNRDVNFGLPRIEVEGFPFDRIRFGADRSETTPGIFAQNTFEVRDTLSKVVGPHGLKFGAEIRREQDNNNLAGGARPLFSFVGLFNLANDTPIFESINTDPVTGRPADAQRYFRTTTYGFFVQDDWKVRPDLTFNLGLRYEYFTPLREKRGRIARLVFPPGDLSGARISIGEELFEPDRNNFAPRLGFAWNPAALERKLVLRGGFGVGYNRTPGVLFGNTRGNPPFFARNNICCGTATTDFGSPFVGGRILYTLGASDSPFSYPVNPVLAQGIDPQTGGVIGNTVEIWGTEPELRNAYVYSYSLEAEYELPFELVASLGYQGSSGHKLIRIVNMNLFLPPNPSFNPVFFLRPDVNANYNAMLARLTRRFANGIQFDANYRWSKSIDTLSFEGPGAVTNQTNPGDLASERGPSDFDVTHYLVVSGLWDLPILRNRDDWLGKLFGGWQINGVLTARSGFPWTPKLFLALRQPSGEFFGPIRPARYFGGALDDTGDEAFLRPGGNFPGGGADFFDTVTVAQPGIGRNSFRGPRYRSVDLSLVKETKFGNIRGLGEGASLQLRANFFNAFNELNLSPIGFFSPGAIITDPNFGRAESGLAGRVIELQARFSF